MCVLLIFFSPLNCTECRWKNWNLPHAIFIHILLCKTDNSILNMLAIFHVRSGMNVHLQFT